MVPDRGFVGVSRLNWLNAALLILAGNRRIFETMTVDELMNWMPCGHRRMGRSTRAGTRSEPVRLDGSGKPDQARLL